MKYTHAVPVPGVRAVSRQLWKATEERKQLFFLFEPGKLLKTQTSNPRETRRFRRNRYISHTQSSENYAWFDHFRRQPQATLTKHQQDELERAVTMTRSDVTIIGAGPYDPRDGHYELLDVNRCTWGYHTLGARAGVDFAHMLYADSVGQRVHPCRARPGLSSIRLITDPPTAIVESFRGRHNWRTYVESLKMSNIESVFSTGDLVPGLAEMALLPYFSLRRGL